MKVTNAVERMSERDETKELCAPGLWLDIWNQNATTEFYGKGCSNLPISIFMKNIVSCENIHYIKYGISISNKSYFLLQISSRDCYSGFTSPRG